MSVEITTEEIIEALLDDIRELHHRLAMQRVALQVTTKERDRLLEERAQLLGSSLQPPPPPS